MADRRGRDGTSAPVGRRRRLVAAAALGALVAGALAAALLPESESERRERSQLEAAAPGASKSPRRAVSVDPAVRRAVESLSLPRQVAQLFAVDVVGQYPRDPFFARFAARRWGTLVLGPANFVNEGQLTALTGEINVIARQTRGPVPLIAVNQSGGSSSAFPQLPPQSQPRVGRSGRPRRARAQARAAGRALNALGINANLAPVADVGAAAGPMQSVVFSDNPVVVARMVRAAVDGYLYSGIVPMVGHFPGTGAASADPDVATASVGLSLPELRARDLKPFAAVSRSAPIVVVSNAVYAAYDGATPAVLEPRIIGGLLRRDLRYRGVVMTGDLNSTAPVVGRNVGAVAVDALAAGADLLYVSGGGAEQERAYRAVLAAVRRGRISRERLRLSVLRVLSLKRRFGLLPSPRRRR